MADIIPERLLHSKRVVVIGAGAAGKPCVDALAWHRVGTRDPGFIAVLDNDRVEQRNLSRCGYWESQLGMAKPQACKQQAMALCSRITFHDWNVKLTRKRRESMLTIARKADLVVWAIVDPIVTDLSDAIHNDCDECIQMQIAVFERAEYALVGFSIPDQTTPLSTAFGQGTPEDIQHASAVAIDSRMIGTWAARLAIRLLLPLDDQQSQSWFPIYRNSPLFAIGFKRTFLFSQEGPEWAMSAYAIGVDGMVNPPSTRRKV